MADLWGILHPDRCPDIAKIDAKPKTLVPLAYLKHSMWKDCFGFWNYSDSHFR